MNELAAKTTDGPSASELACGAFAYLRKVEPDYFDALLYLRVQKTSPTGDRVAPKAAIAWNFLQKLNQSITSKPKATTQESLWDLISSVCLFNK